jgi:hypothetical protein
VSPLAERVGFILGGITIGGLRLDCVVAVDVVATLEGIIVLGTAELQPDRVIKAAINKLKISVNRSGRTENLHIPEVCLAELANLSKSRISFF